MTPFLIAAIIAGVVILIALRLGKSGPSVIMFGEIDKAIREVQTQAMAIVRPSSNQGEMPDFNENAMQKQIITVADTIRFV